MTGAAKRIVLEVVGWGLLLVGIAALVLPGPGLILIALGLAVLSQQYEWAERRLEPVRLRALRAAAEGVETVPRIVLSLTAALVLVASGVLALVLVAYSYRRFHGDDGAVEELERAIDDADEAAGHGDR
jgi:ABC-type glycerol-3-phosphate transport system permease component